MTGPRVQSDWIAAERTALVLIDCQVDFGGPDGEMAKRGADVKPAQAAVKQAEILADAARGAGIAIMFVRLITHPGGENRIAREAKLRHGKDEAELCVEGTRGADFIGPQPQPGDAVISKTHFSAFARTGLAEQLHARGVDTLVLAGLTTECCVASSAWDAFERDFHIFIASDACAAYEAALHDGALGTLEMSGAAVAPTAEFVAGWKNNHIIK